MYAVSYTHLDVYKRQLLKGALPVYVAVGMGLVTDSWFPLIMAAPVLGHAYSLFYQTIWDFLSAILMTTPLI